MTDDISAPASGFDTACWLARDQEFVRLCKSALSENKTALFDALARARIDTLEVTFNGYAGNDWRITAIQSAKAWAASPENAAKLKEFKVV